MTEVLARDSCDLNDAEGPTSQHRHQDSRRGHCDAHGCCSDIQSRPSFPQLGVLVLADSRDITTTATFTREQASKRDIEDLGEQYP